MTISEIAETLGAALPAGADGGLMITGPASLEEARETEVAFFEHPKYVRALRASRAGVILVPPDFAEPIAPIALRVANPSAAFSIILEKLAPPALTEPPGIHPAAVVHETAEIDPTARVEACAVIGAGAKVGARSRISAHALIGRGARVGEDTAVHANAVVAEGCLVGSRVIVHSGAVIGSDGFGFRFAEGRHEKVIHRGIVQIDDDVEIGACTTIDRARFGRTWIQTGTKIDNLVQIAHNVTIGPHCLIVAQTGISGSTRLGRHVVLAGQVGVVGHIEIGDEVVATAKSGISKDTAPRQQLMGRFAIPIKEARELVAHYHRLPKTAERIKTLESEVRELRSLVAQLLAQRAPYVTGSAQD